MKVDVENDVTESGLLACLSFKLQLADPPLDRGEWMSLRQPDERAKVGQVRNRPGTRSKRTEQQGQYPRQEHLARALGNSKSRQCFAERLAQHSTRPRRQLPVVVEARRTAVICISVPMAPPINHGRSQSSTDIQRQPSRLKLRRLVTGQEGLQQPVHGVSDGCGEGSWSHRVTGTNLGADWSALTAACRFFFCSGRYGDR